MLTGEAEWPISEETFQDDCRLLEAGDTGTCRVEAHPRVFVLLAQPARTETDLETSVREHVKGGEFLCQHRWLPEVLSQHRLRDPQRCGGIGDCLPGDQRRERPHEVIRQAERRISERLDGAGRPEQLFPLRRGTARVPEAEWPHYGAHIQHLFSKAASGRQSRWWHCE